MLPTPGSRTFTPVPRDLAVRFGRGIYPGLHAQCLMGDAVVPVCSPGLARGAAAFTLEQIVR